jgi:hypothetical protein
LFSTCLLSAHRNRSILIWYLFTLIVKYLSDICSKTLFSTCLLSAHRIHSVLVCYMLIGIVQYCCYRNRSVPVCYQLIGIVQYLFAIICLYRHWLVPVYYLVIGIVQYLSAIIYSCGLISTCQLSAQRNRSLLVRSDASCSVPTVYRYNVGKMSRSHITTITTFIWKNLFKFSMMWE